MLGTGKIGNRRISFRFERCLGCRHISFRFVRCLVFAATATPRLSISKLSDSVKVGSSGTP